MKPERFNDCATASCGVTPTQTFVVDRARQQSRRKKKRKSRYKTYSSRDSHVVTHRSTNLPFNCLCMAERTGCPVFS
ncbi:hypothetical protein KCU85_g8009, partial [Aureobasidium melanogenum]